MTCLASAGLPARLEQTRGESHDAIYRAVARALLRRAATGDIADVGCGTGRLTGYLPAHRSYVGIDAARYDGFPAGVEFLQADLDREPIPCADAAFDVVVAVETVEHLENPRAFCRELVRVLRPGGWLVVTTPNQRSLLSLAALLVKGHFAAFLDGSYPAHVTALLDTDLRRIATENGLADIAVEFSGLGRLPLTARHFPRALSRAWPRACSDNVLLIARKPRAEAR